jgi:hypothetical protein
MSAMTSVPLVHFEKWVDETGFFLHAAGCWSARA